MVITLLFIGCSDNNEDTGCTIAPESTHKIFEFKHDSTNDVFRAWTKNTEVIQSIEEELAKPFEARTKHINGPIKRLPVDCDTNQEWSWYFVPDEWVMAEISIELCDGNPQYVEENLDEYVGVVGHYCPWGSKVIRQLPHDYNIKSHFLIWN